MKPIAFDYARPRELGEALACLARHGDDARVLAGGQSLAPMLNLRKVRPGLLVDVNDVAGLDGLRYEGRTLEVGATVRQRRLELDPLVRARFPLLADAIPLIGRIPIRNRGTLAGSLVHADPAAELPTVAVASGAELTVASAHGARTVAAERFFTGRHRTALATGELVTAVRFTAPPPRTGQAWVESSRRYADLALVGVACEVTLTGDGDVERAAVVCAGVAERPWRAPAASYDELPRAAAEQCAAADDARTTAAHRRRLVDALTRRALELARRRAGEHRAA